MSNNKLTNKLTKGYNHNDWINLCDNIVNFLIVFGTIINLIIFAIFGFTFSCFTSFVTLMVMGVCRLSVSLIKYFRE